MRAARWLLVAAVVLLAPAVRTQAQSGPSWLNAYREDVAKLIHAATSSDFAWRRLAEFTDLHGARLSGSDNLERAIGWAADKMKADGLENVHTEPVMVPKWVRGRESAEIVDPPRHDVAMLGLGGTVATPPEGIEAEVLPVNSFEDLQARSAEAKGRIVLFNVPYTSYSETVTYRTTSARAAAQFGAVGVLVRSVGPIGLRTAHTGSVQYAPELPEIPAASISLEDTNRIVRLTQRGRFVRMRLVTSGHYEPDALSANVVAEIRGREKPDEIVLLGAHIDSWDVGTGAADDGVGCMVTWESLRLMKKLGLRPRRTVRLVLFTNEENGVRGASAYADRYAETAGNHVFALESDSGVLWPAMLGFSGSSSARAAMAQIGTLLTPLGLAEVGPGGGGADIGPIAQIGNVPTMAYLGDATRFFVFHHTAADTVERIAPDDVSRAAAAIAAVTWVVAEMPERLPR